ncbi:MAG: DNA alkylation repair protein, partial [Bryobacteraceae bacterium]
AFGLTVPQIRAIARRAGKSQPLAEQLWATGIRRSNSQKTLASSPAWSAILKRFRARPWMAGPATSTRGMSANACCCNLFDRTPHAWAKIAKWAGNRREYVRRAAFSTLAGIAAHDKTAEDRLFLDALALIENYAFDDRNFVRKAVNWALRNIGKRNTRLLPAAVACAERIRAQGSRPARWIAADALREFRLKLRMLKFGYQSLKPCKTSLRDRLRKSIPPSPNSYSKKRAARTARSN